MTANAKENNVTFPSSFYLIDINLENPGNKYNDGHIKEEEKFFSENADKGRMILHTTIGENTDPFDFNSSYVEERAKTFNQWSRDDLPEFIESVHAIVANTNVTVTNVIYIHCECGCDRTGEVSGSYYMRYLNMSLHDAHQLDTKIAGREMYKYNHYALNWYCFYLKYALNFDLTCEA